MDSLEVYFLRFAFHLIHRTVSDTGWHPNLGQRRGSFFLRRNRDENPFWRVGEGVRLEPHSGTAANISSAEKISHVAIYPSFPWNFFPECTTLPTRSKSLEVYTQAAR